jgi:putative RNA 2'-phosphotransferase
MADRRRKGQRRKLSKFLSLLLRHRPARFPIALDPEGYADLHEIEHILQGLPNFRWVTRADIDAVVDVPGRRRFEITHDGRIRALYGHTAIRPTYPAVVPPEVLWHGTAPAHLEAIMAEGLRPMRRQYVHLAASPETARDIGRRHAPTPVLLRIDAAAAHAAGIAFHHPVPEIYLCAALPARYLSEASS